MLAQGRTTGDYSYPLDTPPGLCDESDSEAEGQDDEGLKLVGVNALTLLARLHIEALHTRARGCLGILGDAGSRPWVSVSFRGGGRAAGCGD